MTVVLLLVRMKGPHIWDVHITLETTLGMGISGGREAI